LARGSENYQILKDSVRDHYSSFSRDAQSSDRIRGHRTGKRACSSFVGELAPLERLGQRRAALRSGSVMAKKVKKNAFDPKVFLATVSGGRAKFNYRKDGVVFSQGEAADAVFYIHKGKVKIVVTSEQGKEAVVAILGASEFFGEGCLISQPLRLATATALVESEVMRVDKREMIRVLHAEPAFAEVFTTHLLTRKNRAEEDLIDQLFNSSEKRLARTLLLLVNFGKNGKTEAIETKISQEMLAEMVGTTRPRICFFMNKFRKLGLIDYNKGDLHVHSSLLSVVLRG
jgi:CRP/FNR family cyclic AMP-dependent transcriptional regulator